MTFKIHPAIGIARLGNSPTSFYLAPERTGDLPIDCDSDGRTTVNATGRENPIQDFRDRDGLIRRQAARFRVFVYEGANSQGRELKIGDRVSLPLLGANLVLPAWCPPPPSGIKSLRGSGQVYEGKVVDILWTVYVANKKAVWYQFQETEGEHGYDPSHPLRNSDVTAPGARQKLIIDPGPQTVRYTVKKQRLARFAAGANPGVPQTFPPPLVPASIATLGEIRAIEQEDSHRLLVLGGHGISGSCRTEFGQPYITEYANNDGWFDDTSDGPVVAQLVVEVTAIDGKAPDPNIYPHPYRVSVPVDESAWVIVGYPRYVPQVTDMVTLDDVAYDLAVRYFAFDPALYGTPPFDGAKPGPNTPESLDLWRRQAAWNPDYYPHFERDIWPILQRPNNYTNLMTFDPTVGGDPHDTGARGNFDQSELAVPPYQGEPPEDRARRARKRMFLYRMLRQPGQENDFTLSDGSGFTGPRPIGMPWLCGDNPISNVAPAKFLRLTDTMLFLLRQWADGKFINDEREHIQASTGGEGVELDRGVLGNLLGGSFCPGAEASWIMRNPAIYARPYRLSLSLTAVPGGLSTTGNLQTGLEPGDITKYSALPWQSDFNECSTQPIDVTYRDWNVNYPASTGDPAPANVQTTFWWPAHRPMQITLSDGTTYPWSGAIPQTPRGDLEMVTGWRDRDFLFLVEGGLQKDSPSDPSLPSATGTTS